MLYLFMFFRINYLYVNAKFTMLRIQYNILTKI